MTQGLALSSSHSAVDGPGTPALSFLICRVGMTQLIATVGCGTTELMCEAQRGGPLTFRAKSQPHHFPAP